MVSPESTLTKVRVLVHVGADCRIIISFNKEELRVGATTSLKLAMLHPLAIESFKITNTFMFLNQYFWDLIARPCMHA